MLFFVFFLVSACCITGVHVDVNCMGTLQHVYTCTCICVRVYVYMYCICVRVCDLCIIPEMAIPGGLGVCGTSETLVPLVGTLPSSWRFLTHSTKFPEVLLRRRGAQHGSVQGHVG